MAAMLLTAWPQVSCESFSSSSGSFELEKLRREAGEPCDESRRAPLCSCVPYWNLWEEGDVEGQKQQERCPKAGPQSAAHRGSLLLWRRRSPSRGLGGTDAEVALVGCSVHGCGWRAEENRDSRDRGVGEEEPDQHKGWICLSFGGKGKMRGLGSREEKRLKDPWSRMPHVSLRGFRGSGLRAQS